MFRQFAALQPELRDRQNGDTPDHDALRQMDPFLAVLGSYLFWPADSTLATELMDRAADALEAIAETGATVGSCYDETPIVEEDSLPGPEVMTELEGQIAELRGVLKQREGELKSVRAELKSAKSDLNKRVAEVSRKDRKAGELKAEKRTAEAARDTAQVEARAAREERDEFGRQNRKLLARVESSQSGQRTIEVRRADEIKSAQQTITDLREQLAASRELVLATEKRVTAVEAELTDERQHRSELEEVLESVGFEDFVASSQSLQAALGALVRFQGGVQSYVARQEERERERVRLQEIALAEREAAKAARKVQEDAAVAWESRERERVEELEGWLFPDGQVDHIIIDGHNLIGRIYRPDTESATRPWLQRMVEVMAERLEGRGWASCVHLTFDTPHASDNHSVSHGVRVYFKNKAEGGADAQIASLLRDGNPQANYMVVSTDRKHVWSDALELIRDEGAEVDLVQVELLAQYLQALDEVNR